MEVKKDTERVLIFVPQGRDAEITLKVLDHHGIEGKICADLDDLCTGIFEGAGCAIVTDESLPTSAIDRLVRVLAEQPPWSDFPFIVSSAQRHRYAATPREPIRALGNIAIVETPMKTRALINAVRTALRARHRQYDAKRAIEQRDQFLAMLGHELRNPLGAITLATQILKRKTANSDKFSKEQSVLDRQTRHLARLVDDLLDVSRVTSGKIVLKSNPLDLGVLLQRCVETMSTTARTHQIMLSNPVTPNQYFIQGDPDRLEQIFSNLLNNAIKYSPAGSTIRVATQIQDKKIHISIEDVGVGIQPSMLRKIFDLFTQAETTIDRARGGMGIGLTLVKSLVELHGGTVEATSRGTGLGSTFVVKIPLTQATIGSEVGKSAANKTALRALRVVLVEDSDDIRETSRDALEALGCEVGVAEDGPSGLACILSTKPDIALIDIGLPGIDGYEVSRRVRATLGDKITLVALTGYGLPEDHERAQSAGFDAHLTKPVTLPMLEYALSEAQNSGYKNLH